MVSFEIPYATIDTEKESCFVTHLTIGAFAVKLVPNLMYYEKWFYFNAKLSVY